MKRINYHHLYYFWRIAVVGKLTDVAVELHISQSALSAQIKQLEEQIGSPLFIRQNRQLTLTDAGKKVLQYAQEIFTIGGELEHLIQKGIAPDTQHIAIGVLNNLSRNFVDDFISPLLKEPSITFRLDTRGLADLLKGLANHEFDLVLTNTTIASLDTDNLSHTLWQTQLVKQQPVAIVGPAGQKPNDVFLNSYHDKMWVLPGRKTEIRSAFESWCAIQQFQPKIKAEADDMAMLRLLARDSGAVAVLPPVVVKDEITQGILEVYQPVPNTFENFYAISAKKKYTPSVIAQLLKASNELA